MITRGTHLPLAHAHGDTFNPITEAHVGWSSVDDAFLEWLHWLLGPELSFMSRIEKDLVLPEFQSFLREIMQAFDRIKILLGYRREMTTSICLVHIII
jgi:hypothetical protein